jgi:catechol 2,3-dioxygenase-like lactoylglutathione lyase family enzyme
MSGIAEHHQIHGLQPVLPVPDVAAAADWFCRVLGFEIDFLLGEPPVHGRVKLGDGRWGAPVFIHLSRAAGPVQPCGELRLHAGHDVDGLHAHALAQLPACGGRVTMPPTDQPWGLREFAIEGPAGHRLRIGADAG